MTTAVLTAAYDATGRRTSTSDNGTTTSYSYDGLYRLTAAVRSSGTAYRSTYDAAGNRIQATEGATTTTATYDAANQLVTLNGSTVASDANGNLLNDGTQTYRYDALDRLVATTRQATTTRMGYTSDGDRVWQATAGMTTTYTLDLNAALPQVLGERTGTTATTLVPGLGQRTGGTWQFAHADLLGSLRSLTNAQGQVLATQQYAPFGSVEAPTGAAAPWGFTGAPQDAASGLTYLRARYYHPALGRFLTPDALVPDALNGQAWNGYAYVYNDVANLVDPSGFEPEPPSGFPNQPGNWDGVVDGYHPQVSEPQRSLEFYRNALARTGEAVTTSWQQTHSGVAQWWSAKPTCGCGTPTPAPGGDAVLKTGSIAETAILGHSIWPSINVDIQVTKAQRFAVFGVGLTNWESVGRVLQRPAHEMTSFLGRGFPRPWRTIPLRTPRTGWQTRLHVRPAVSGLRGAMTMLGVGVGMDMLFQFIDDHGFNRRCLSNRDTLARLLVTGGLSAGVGAVSLGVAGRAAAFGRGPFGIAIRGIATTVILNEVVLPSTKQTLLDTVTSN